MSEKTWKEKDAVTLPWVHGWQTNGDTSVRSGIPGPDHNCDQMGCSSISHALEWRKATDREKEYYALVKKNVMFPPMTNKEPEKLAERRFCDECGRFQIFLNGSHTDSSDTIDAIMPQINAAANAWASALIKKTVNAKLEEAAKEIDLERHSVSNPGYLDPHVKSSDDIRMGQISGFFKAAEVVRKLKED